jgi:hypothetical protein
MDHSSRPNVPSTNDRFRKAASMPAEDHAIMDYASARNTVSQKNRSRRGRHGIQ